MAMRAVKGSKKEREFQEISSDFFKLESQGDTISGILEKKDTMPFSKNGVTNIVGRYTIRQDDADKPTVVLGSTGMDDKMESIPLGTYIRLTHAGSVKTSGGNSMKDIRVEIAKE